MMTKDDLDRVLIAKDEDIPVSSDLAPSIMEAIRSENVMPRPIPFPWKRALPGLAATGVTLAGLLAFVFEQLAHVAVPLPTNAIFPAGWMPLAWSLGWSTTGLLLSLISVVLSMRFTSR